MAVRLRIFFSDLLWKTFEIIKLPSSFTLCHGNQICFPFFFFFLLIIRASQKLFYNSSVWSSFDLTEETFSHLNLYSGSFWLEVHNDELILYASIFFFLLISYCLLIVIGLGVDWFKTKWLQSLCFESIYLKRNLLWLLIGNYSQ